MDLSVEIEVRLSKNDSFMILVVLIADAIGFVE